MVMQELPACFLESGQIRKSGLQTVQVPHHPYLHPLHQGVISHAIEVGKVVYIMQLHEFGYVFASRGRDVEHVFPRRVVVGRTSVRELGSYLPGEVGTLASGVMETLIDFLRHFDVLGRYGAVLLGGAASLAALSALSLAKAAAEAKPERGASLSCAIIRCADYGREIEIEFAEIGSGDDA